MTVCPATLLRPGTGALRQLQTSRRRLAMTRQAVRQAGLFSKTGKMRPSTPMSPTCTLFGMPPRAMTAQFSNSNGGMVGRSVLCPPPSANKRVLVHYDGAHGVTRPTTPRGRRSRVRRARVVRFPATRKRRAGVWP